jgi:hypothetical protein
LLFCNVNHKIKKIKNKNNDLSCILKKDSLAIFVISQLLYIYIFFLAYPKEVSIVTLHSQPQIFKKIKNKKNLSHTSNHLCSTAKLALLLTKDRLLNDASKCKVGSSAHKGQTSE